MDQGSTLDVEVDCSGPPVLHIPTEVCENIIDMLYDPGSTRSTVANVAILCSCALVCRNWRVRSQRRLFYFVQLSTSNSFRRLSTILDTAQHLRDYVYHIEMTGYHLHYTTSIFALFPVVFAGKLPKLERVDVAHLPNASAYETWLPRTPDPPKARSLPYIPLHSCFPTFLSSFTAVSELGLQGITFRSFTEFARMLHGLPNLEELACSSVRWITPGGAHPGADFTRQPDWAAEKQTHPPFAPKLRKLELYDIDMYGAQRLIWSRGPRLTQLNLRIPLLYSPEEPVQAGGINLGSCTGLGTLVLYFAPEFSMDTHAGFVKELLTLWKPQSSAPKLKFCPFFDEFTCQGFADILRSLGTIAEEWLQTIEGQTSEGDSGTEGRLQYQLIVNIYDWEAQGEWWWDHLKGCFPTWLHLKRFDWTLDPPQKHIEEWATVEQPAPADAMPKLAIGPDINADMSSGFSKDAHSPHISHIPQPATAAS